MFLSSWIRKWKCSLDRRWTLQQTLRQRARFRRPRLELLEDRCLLSAYVVTSTADDGSAGTLRGAINAVNAGQDNEIDFDIGTAGSAQTINLTSALPVLTANGVFINGLSQGGSGNTTQLITLNGTNAGSNSDGLLLQGLNCTVSGLLIEDFTQNGIEVAGSNNSIGQNVISGNVGDGVLIDSSVSGTTVQGNCIGTDATGANALANNVGISVMGSGNTIGGTSSAARNIISGNSGDGVLIAASGVTVQGNYIGTDVTGTKALANKTGVDETSSNNTLGGTTTGAGNVISGNTGYGVFIYTIVSGVQVQGNYIGTNAAGNAALANGYGIEIYGDSNTVGGTVSGAANLISGNSRDGMAIDGNSNQVLGNSIGTSAAGNAALANGTGIEGTGSNNTIGGTASGARNLISGNGQAGIDMGSGSDNQVLGNYIGTDATGNTALGNGDGISFNGERGNTIGGTVPGASNLISGNLNYGLYIVYSIDNQVLGNYIGTNVAGNAALANGHGISVSGTNNTVGGKVSAARNLISGNIITGVDIGGSGNQVLGNYIGTDAAGNAALANGDGMGLSGTNNTVGGTVSGAANLISGNTFYGVQLNGTSDQLQGNYIGTNAAGNAALANGNGIYISGGNSNTVGGTVSAARNLISGNSGDGISLSGSSFNQVLGNYIGTDVTGTKAIANRAGLVAGGFDNTIGGTWSAARNIISGNLSQGVLIDGSDMTIQGNYIGTDVTGANAVANSIGIEVQTFSNTVTIGGTTTGAGNVISGNSADGLRIDDSCSGVQVQGNDIGTDAKGANAVGNRIGILAVGSGNTIGGTSSAARNIISGNSGDGVWIAASGVTVQGNYIGTDVTGTKALSNSVGVEDQQFGIILGGTASGAGNVISGNSSDGVLIDSGVSGVAVQGNYIGTDVTGTKSVANNVGVWVRFATNTIGGTTAGAGNVISGNTTEGVLIAGPGNTVQGNYIGINAVGNAALSNSIGIQVMGSSNTIGGSVANAANIVADNGNDGVQVATGTGNTIRLNSIFANSGFGIHLLNGANNNLASPTLAVASVSKNTLTVMGSFTPTTANVSYALDFYTNSSGDDEGKVYLGSLTVTPTSTSSQSFTFTTATRVTSTYPLVTATLTDASGDTSPFSNGVTVSGAPPANVYQVTSTADDGSLGTLRDAITQANASGGAITEIDFGIGAAGSAQTIHLTSALPTLTASGVYINGLSQAGSGNTKRLITLDGTAAGSSSEGLILQGSNEIVSGLILSNFGDDGLVVDGSNNTIGGTSAGAGNVISGNHNDGVLLASSASGVQVQGNSIGTNAAGTSALANKVGIEDAGNHNTLGGTVSGSRNIISGNSNDGVLLASGASGNQVLGNFIGTNIYGNAAVANSGSGVEIAGTNNTIGGTAGAARNIISANSNAGVLLDSGANGNQVLGNYIGTNAAGTAALANKVGIEDAGNHNTLGGSVLGARNLISGNTTDGILLDSTASAETLQSNYIGLGVSGKTALANGTNGIEVAGSNNTIGGNSGSNYYTRNFISGNSGDGVLIDSGASGNQVLGNFIGIDVSGTHGAANVANGIEIAGNSNSIGGTSSGLGNTVSGNSGDGMLIDSTASGNLVAGNYVGSDYSGKLAVANGSNGVEVAGANNTLGGTVSGALNILSGNGQNGVLLDGSASGTVVQGNYIGIGFSNTVLGNGSNGISVVGNNNTIGGSASRAGNTIANNGGDGVLVSSGIGNVISRNSIYSNTAGGISLSNGGNNNLAAASLSSATLSSSTLTVQGSFVAPVANVAYVLEFFANPSGDAEGKIYIGSITVTPTSSGTVSFSFVGTTTVTGANPLITATLTDASGDTSSFSNGVTVS